jgi:hypothetical protein
MVPPTDYPQEAHHLIAFSTEMLAMITAAGGSEAGLKGRMINPASALASGEERQNYDSRNLHAQDKSPDAAWRRCRGSASLL